MITSPMAIFALVVFCVVMFAIGWWLWHREKTHKAENTSRVNHLLALLDKQQKNRIASIKTVATAMQQGQCEQIEGCIRIRMLIEQVQPELLAQAPISIFDIIYEATDHIPIKDNWKSLDKSKKTQLLNAMDKIKTSNATAIAQGVEAVLNHTFAIKPR